MDSASNSTKKLRDEKGRLLPGCTANPRGVNAGPALPPQFLVEAPRTIAREVERAMFSTEDEIQAMRNSPHATMLQKIIAQSLIDLMRAPGKNAKLLDAILSRWAGKAKEEITIRTDSDIKPTIIEIVAKTVGERKSD